MQNASTPISAATIAAAATLESNWAEVNASAWTNNKLVIQVKTTNGSGVYKSGESMTVNWAWAGDSAIANSNSLKATAGSITFPCPQGASEVRYNVSPQIPVQGAYLYLWLAHPEWANTRTVSVSVGTLL